MSETTLDFVQRFTNHVFETGCFFNVLKKTKVISVGNGCLVAELTIEKEHVNHFNTMAGGMACSLVDAFTCIALTTSGEDPNNVAITPVSVNINVSFLSPARLGETIVINCKTVKDGASIQFVEVDITEKKTGRPVCRGLHTHFSLKRGKIQDLIP